MQVIATMPQLNHIELLEAKETQIESSGSWLIASLPWRTKRDDGNVADRSADPYFFGSATCCKHLFHSEASEDARYVQLVPDKTLCEGVCLPISVEVWIRSNRERQCEPMAARQNKLASLLTLALCLLAVACSRSRYRAAADLQSNALIRSRQVDNRWVTPNRDVEPARQSRMNLSMNLDCPAKPPDDPAASPWMYCPDGHRNTKYWQQIPDAGRIENWQWLDSLPRRDDGSVLLNQKTAIDLALLHSRDYQTQYEAVYLTALNLTGNQFEFQTQWNGGAGLGYTATGADLGNNRLLQFPIGSGFNAILLAVVKSRRTS